jgi:hypothetical protein
MNMKRMAAIVVAGAALAAWLTAAATSGNRDVETRVVERAAPINARADALAGEIARLHERLRPAATPRQPGRNLFQFTAARARPAPAAVAPPPPAEPARLVPVASPPPPFKLIGIAEDTGPDGPVRTAIVSAPGQLYLAKEGQSVTPRYRVAKISADVVEFTDEGDNSVLRLALR